MKAFVPDAGGVPFWAPAADVKEMQGRPLKTIITDLAKTANDFFCDTFFALPRQKLRASLG